MGDSNYEIPEEKASGRGKIKRLRNLAQYRDLSDEQFDNLMSQKSLNMDMSEEFEKRIQRKMDQFSEDYDLSDLKINDKETLRALIQTVLTLEDYEQALFKLRSGGLTHDFVIGADKLHKAMSDLRADISKLQNDLNITRRVRKSDQDISVMAYIDGLKEKAKKFYENKMSYIFCPKCNMLLATVWSLYPDSDKNKIVLVCERITPDGTKCGEKVIITTRELLNSRGTNNKKITPESML